MQTTTKLNNRVVTKLHPAAKSLIDTNDDLLHALAIKQSAPLLPKVGFDQDEPAAQSVVADEPIVLAEATTVLAATDASPAAAGSHAGPATAAPVHVLSTPIPAGTEVGLGYVGLSSGGMGVWGWLATIGGVGAVAAAGGNKSSSSSASAGGATTTPTTTTTTTTTGTALASVLAGTDHIISYNEKSTATVLTVLAPIGYRISGVVIEGISKTGTRTNVATFASGGDKYTFDATQFSDGELLVKLTMPTTTGSTQITMKESLTLISGQVVSNTLSTSINASQDTTSTQLTIYLQAGDTLQKVWVQGADKNTLSAKTVTATVNANGTATFDATSFADAQLQVIFTSTLNTTSQSAFIFLDTIAPSAPPFITATYLTDMIGSSTNPVNSINFARDTTTSPLIIIPDATTSTVQSASVSGISKTTGLSVSVTAIKDTTNLVTYWSAAGTANSGATYSNYVGWTFDATQFADGTLNLSGVSADRAGNTSTFTKSLILNTALVISNGDSYINSTENKITSGLTVYATGNPYVNAVTVTGKDATGATISKVATTVSGGTVASGNLWSFDATAFVDGQLSVVVQTLGTTGVLTTQPAVYLTKDTVAPAGAAVLAGTDAVLSANEISTASVLAVTAPSGNTISGVTVTGINISTGVSTTVKATQNVNGNWVFDATVFNDGTLTVTPTVVSVSGNTNSFTPTNITLNSGSVLAGGDFYINAAEATTAAVLTLYPASGDTITGVSLSGTLKTGRTAPAVNWTTGASTATFDATAYADGTISVTVTSTNVPAGKVATLTLDTVTPAGASAPYFTYMNYNSTPSVGSVNVNLSTAGNSKTPNSSMILFGANTGDTIVSANVSGVSSTTGLAVNTNLTSTDGTRPAGSSYALFDATKFANGYVVENTVWSDAAGNRFTQSTLMSMTSNGVAPSTHVAKYITPVHSANSIATNYTQAQLAGVGGFFPQATVSGTVTGVVMEGITSSTGITSATNTLFTAVLNGSGGLDITASATGAGYGSVNLMATDTAGNQVINDFSVAVTNATGVTGGNTTNLAGATVVGSTVNTAGALYDDSASIVSEVFNISGTNTNTVMLGGTAADTFILNTATLDFAQINGDVNGTANTGLDILQLTPNYNTIDLSHFNYAGQQVIQQIEVIDMATDTGADKVTLTPSDLFHMHSNQSDAINTTTAMLTINGGTNDTVNLLTGGFVKTASTTDFTLTGATQGVADITGTTAGYYSKYTATFNDTGGSHLVEVLIQHGVAVA